MGSIRTVIAAVTVGVGLAASSGAYAVDAAVAWGTINNSDGGSLYNSARLAATEAGVANSAASGGESAFRSVTTCGTCVTLSINGNNNSISDNTITSTNSGPVTGYGYFY